MRPVHADLNVAVEYMPSAYVEFSRHAARKLRIARYCRMPHGRPGMPSWAFATKRKFGGF